MFETVGLQLLAYTLLHQHQQHCCAAHISSSKTQTQDDAYEGHSSQQVLIELLQRMQICGVITLALVFHAAGLRTHLPRHTMSCTTTHTAWT
jgi:hypothetical protein